ncbi:MAG: hypothetical protein ACP5QN_01075 [Minisyncoccia bacterium]
MEQIPNKPIIKGGFETSYFKEKKEIPIEFYKSVIFDILSLAGAFILGYFLFSYLNNKTGIFPVLLFGMLYLILVSFEAVLNDNWARRIFIIFLESLGIFYWFFDKNNFFVIFILGSAFLIFRIWGEIKTYQEAKNILEIKFLKLTRFVFSKSIMAIVLIGVGFYLVSFNPQNGFISQNYFKNLWDNFSLIYQKIYPEINLNNSFYDFSYSLVNYKLQSNKDFQNLLPDEKEKILKESTDKTNENILKILGQSDINFNQKFSKLIYLTLSKKLNNLYDLYGIYFLTLWGVLLFVIWLGIIFIFKFIFNIVLFIVFEILLSLGVLKILGETRTKEVLRF